jgi:hypothetical protein
MSRRISGQDVLLTITSAGQPVAALSDFKSFEIELMFDRKQEGFLGETSDRFDEFLTGFKFTADLELESQDVFKFLQSIIDRATRRTNALQIDIAATLQFPDGSRPKFFGNDAFFSAVPLSFGGRTEFGTIKLDGAGSNPRLVLS